MALDCGRRGCAESSALGDDDLLVEVFLHLDVRALVRCARVSRRWRALARADRAWAPLVAARWSRRHVPWARVRELPTWCERYGLAEQLAAVSALSTAELVRLIFTFSMNGREVRFVERPDGRRFVQTDWTSQLPWRLNADGTLQVDHYPRHTVSRLSNWGWRTANAYVALDSRPEAADGALQDELDKACGLLRPSACGA